MSCSQDSSRRSHATYFFVFPPSKNKGKSAKPIDHNELSLSWPSFQSGPSNQRLRGKRLFILYSSSPGEKIALLPFPAYSPAFSSAVKNEALSIAAISRAYVKSGA